MIISLLTFGEKQKPQKGPKEPIPKKSKAVTLPQIENISHVPKPYIPVPTGGPVFKGIKFNKMIQEVKGRPSIGADLFTPDGKWIDFSKLKGEEKDLDVLTATDQEIYADWHAHYLRESQNPYKSQYNSDNMDKYAATYPTLNSLEAEDRFRANRARLWDFNKNRSLDVPVIDEHGNLTLDGIAFDTESTGTNIERSKKNLKRPLDRIVQVGAIQVKGGLIVPDSAVSQLINPEMPIPEGATKVNGINDFMVRNEPTIGRFLRGFTQDYLHKKNGVLIIYNSKFDRTILNNSIRHYNSTVSQNEQIKERMDHKILDPFILIQRIHPYVSARKKLGEVYRALFCKKMQGAHDALSDVVGTVDVLKYCLYWLGEKRKDKSRPLMLREVLAFQNGETKIKNLDFRMDSDDCNADVHFDMSERDLSIPVINHHKSYALKKSDLEHLAPEIGYSNLARLKKSRTNRKGDFVPMDYKKRSNFVKVLGFAKMEPYNGKSVEEIHETIANTCHRTIDQKAIMLCMKNPNPEDISKGNDLPDINIIRRVMQEAKENKTPNVLPNTIKLEETPGANAKKSKSHTDDED